MGIGIPTIASLSKDGIAEFRSVSLNTKGQEEGLVATYTLEGHGGWILPAEHPDSRYVFNVDDATPEITNMKTGVWVRVKNAKQYTKEKVYKKLSKIFARKLSAGYHIQLREAVSDTFEGVRQPEDFCNKHEIVVGMIHDNRLGPFPVYADIHPAEKPADAIVELLTKKMTMDRYLSEYMAKGYFNCDVLDFKPDREGMAIDQYNPRFAQLEEIILREYRRQGIDKKPTEHMENQKRSRKWKEKATEIFLRYYAKHPLDSLLRVDAMLTQKDAITGEPIGKRKRVTKPTRRCPNGYHWDKRKNKCISFIEIEKEPREPEPVKEPRGPNTPHWPEGDKDGGSNRRKITDQYTDQSKPDFEIIKRSDPEKFCVWINERESAVVLNTYYPWTKEAWDNANDITMDILMTIAMVNAVPENSGLGSQEFLTKLAQSL